MMMMMPTAMPQLVLPPPGFEGEDSVWLRGLPFTVTEDDVRNFFEGYHIKGLHLSRNDGGKFQGQPNGNAYVKFGSSLEAMSAIESKNRQHIGNRYVEVMPPGGRGGANIPSAPPAVMGTERREASSATRFHPYRRENPGAVVSYPGMAGYGMMGMGSPCSVRLRGLPFSISENDVRAFFAGYAVVSVELLRNPVGKFAGQCNGHAVVTFAHPQEAVRAQQEKNNQYLGERYIEVQPYSASPQEAYAACVAPYAFAGYAPSWMPTQVAYPTSSSAPALSLVPPPGFTPVDSIRLRGLPFTITEQAIYEFFSGFSVAAVYVGIHSEGKFTGRPNGLAYVKFANLTDVSRAITEKDRQHIGERYVEVMAIS